VSNFNFYAAAKSCDQLELRSVRKLGRCQIFSKKFAVAAGKPFVKITKNTKKFDIKFWYFAVRKNY
jgi:hypothetical protein